jgi:hypothetical protein
MLRQNLTKTNSVRRTVKAEDSCKDRAANELVAGVSYPFSGMEQCFVWPSVGLVIQPLHAQAMWVCRRPKDTFVQG